MGGQLVWKGEALEQLRSEILHWHSIPGLQLLQLGNLVGRDLGLEHHLDFSEAVHVGVGEPLVVLDHQIKLGRG